MTAKSPALIAGRYEVGKLLGSGGMAEVYAGIDRRLRRPVAVKLLRAEMVLRPEVRNRFEAEARLAAVIAHPNAVSIYDTGEHAGVPFIVMERLPGPTLADAMAKGPVDPEWVRRVARQVLGALESAHVAGLVHRDVKPSNILITADGQAKIADFGIAKSLVPRHVGADPTLTGQLIGTPAYLAPEQLQGRPATPRSDIYSMGVLLYEAIAGAKPLSPPRSLAELRSEVDPALAAVVHRAISADPEARFATAGEMGVALSLTSNDATVVVANPMAARGADPTVAFDRPLVSTPQPGPVAGRIAPVPSPRGRSRRTPAVAIVVVFVLVAAMVGVAMLARSRAGKGPDTKSAAFTNPLAQELASAADALTPADGPRSADVAKRLQRVAEVLDTGDASLEATDLMGKVTAWDRSGELARPVSARILGLLSRVPGVVLPVTSPTQTVPRNSGTIQTPPTTVKETTSTVTDQTIPTDSTAPASTTETTKNKNKDKTPQT